MGYMRHHAIVVTSSVDRKIADAHAAATLIFAASNVGVSPVVVSSVNNYRSFFVAPDGSKEGWDASAAGNGARDAFVAWLHGSRYDDGSSSFDWVEVQYGDDDGKTKVIRHSDKAAVPGFDPSPPLGRKVPVNREARMARCDALPEKPAKAGARRRTR